MSTSRNRPYAPDSVPDGEAICWPVDTRRLDSRHLIEIHAFPQKPWQETDWFEGIPTHDLDGHPSGYAAYVASRKMQGGIQEVRSGARRFFDIASRKIVGFIKWKLRSIGEKI